jgi:hypothetical protein
MGIPDAKSSYNSASRAAAAPQSPPTELFTYSSIITTDKNLQNHNKNCRSMVDKIDAHKFQCSILRVEGQRDANNNDAR